MIPTVTQALTQLSAGTLTSEVLVTQCLARIAELDASLNAFITVRHEDALREARVLDAERAAGRLRGPLHGIPIAIKDNIDTAGIRTTAASAVFAERVPEADAEVVQRLKQAGAIILGKTNLQEFGLGSTSVDSHFGPVRNLWDETRYAGGSSGGSACAVAAGMAPAALGTDTGGSIRTPAAYCGVVGFKPTYGLVPLKGIIPAKLSLDHCGPLTRTVADALLLFDVLAGTHTKLTSVHQLRVGVPRPYYFENVDDAVAACVEPALQRIGQLTAGLRDVALPAVDRISLAGETFAYHREHWERDPHAYTPHASRAILNDSKASLGGYIRSRWLLDELRAEIDQAFDGFDVVVLPTRRHLPETIHEYLERDRLDVVLPENTGPFNIYGIPAISVPCGWTANGLPVGLTIAGPRHHEAKVLSLAHAFEQVFQSVPFAASSR